jgi:leucyl-tRNA synthetase
MVYNHAVVEKKWQDYWHAKKLFAAPEPPRKKFYNLEMFAYPSGDIHMGQGKNYVIGDVFSRFKTRQGYDVLHPFGWDAFGLPAENQAIKMGIHPEQWTMNNIRISDESLKMLGIAYDWEREIITCLPDYYKWTQWMFLLLYGRGLAYKKEALVNWCPGCQTVLANEQVTDGRCYRCAAVIEKKKLNQWFFKITEYAERLLRDIDRLTGWTDNIRDIQRAWIGRSTGCEISFKVADQDIVFNVFTTRPDTIYGVTFMSIAPEHFLVEDLIRGRATADAVRNYVRESTKKSEIERVSKEKDGIFTGAYAANPMNGEKVPIFVADYVLLEYGSGIVMGVPAHDERDFQFARKYRLPVKVVIRPPEGELKTEGLEHAYEAPGIMVDSGPFTGMDSIPGIKAVSDHMTKNRLGGPLVRYRLKDWLISRQRYWGAPIPIICCSTCGMVPVPEKDLPVTLPRNVSDFLPKGKSPLAAVDSFMDVSCPKCGSKARRDPDTMDTFVCSSWYYLRYLDPQNEREFCSRPCADTWLPIDQYIGGSSEHATGHLIYFRFFAKILFDAGYIGVDEPAKNLFNLGMVLKDGSKMSKSKGNVVPIGEFVRKHGADVARLTICSAAPPEREMEWSDEGVAGSERFLDRVYRLLTDNLTAVSDRKPDPSFLGPADRALYIKINQTIARVTEDLETFKFNTAIAFLWELLNALYAGEKESSVFGHGLYVFINLLSPVAPHLADELWSLTGRSGSLMKEPWPVFDPAFLKGNTVTVVIQINGKVRAHMEVDIGTPEPALKELALKNEKVQRHLAGKEIRKTIYVPDKLLNIVV